jgi:ABC-type proline/glycine betaine transport system permease subunit
MYSWITANRQDHWLFTDLQPDRHAIDAFVRFVLWILRGLRWTGVVVLTAYIGLSTGIAAMWAWPVRRRRRGLLGLTMITLALMIVSIVLALAIGIPRHLDRPLRSSGAPLRPILTRRRCARFVYLGVLVLALASSTGGDRTIVYAIPPAVRLTNRPARRAGRDERVGESSAARCTAADQVQLPFARRTIARPQPGD